MLANRVQVLVAGAAIAYPNGSRATQLPFQATLKLARESRLVGIVEVHDTSNTEERGNESADHHEAGAGRCPGILPRRKDTEDIVVLVDWFTKVSSLLRVPPVAIRVAELSLDSRGVDVAAVLGNHVDVSCAVGTLPRMARTNHSRIFSLGHLRSLGILLIESFLVCVLRR